MFLYLVSCKFLEGARYNFYGNSGINYHWKTIRKIMMGRVRVTMQAKTDDGKILYHRSSTKAEGEQKEIYRALKLSSSILRSKKTIL